MDENNFVKRPSANQSISRVTGALCEPINDAIIIGWFSRGPYGDTCWSENNSRGRSVSSAGCAKFTKRIFFVGCKVRIIILSRTPFNWPRSASCAFCIILWSLGLDTIGRTKAAESCRPSSCHRPAFGVTLEKKCWHYSWYTHNCGCFGGFPWWKGRASLWTPTNRTLSWKCHDESN